MNFEEKIGYSFRDKVLRERALTRKAFSKEKKDHGETVEDQEIYRTLGDAVLKAVLVDYLIQGGTRTRAEITTSKIELERKSALAKIARKLDIAQDIRMNNGEQKLKAEEQPYVLAETLEAILGAIYLDGGYCSAMDSVRRWYGPEVFSLPQKS
jgi:ribonuclease-3